MAKAVFLGVEIGGTKLQVGLGHGDGALLQLRRTTINPDAGAEGIRAQVVEEADRACWTHGTTREAIEAVGVGFGGPVDAARGVATTSHHVGGWDGFPLADWCREQFRVEAAAVENDADAAGLGEARFGAGKGRDPVLYVTVGSGVGGGLILGGRIHRGTGHGAAEIGHLWVTPPEDDGRGGQTVEQAGSGWSIGREARRVIAEGRPGSEMLADLVDGDLEQVTAEVVAMAAGLGDAASAAILDRAARALASGLAHAVTLIGPRRIILGGGVSTIGEEFWLAPIRRCVDRLVFPPFRGSFDVVPARLGEAVVVHGALALARDAWKAAQQRDTH